ncbi:MAG: hypothetical protein Q7R78_01190 [bacterium]|nr:hypothetical protein [bacterium]
MLLEPIVTFKTLFFILLIIVFVLYWLLTFTIFYHLIRFGVGTLPKKISIIFLLGSVVLFSINFLMFAAFDFNMAKSRIERLIERVYGINK